MVATGVKSCVVWCCLDVVGLEYIGKFLDFLSAEAVDDTALTLILSYVLDDVAIDVLGFGSYLIIKVRSVEGRLEVCRVHDVKVSLDIGPDLIGGGGGERDNGRVAYSVDDGPDISVLGTEVVSPF